jgi:hypothetical protein
MEAYQAVIVGVVALLAGALLPILFQLFVTLRAVRATVAQVGPALVAATATVERLERLTAKLEEGGRIDEALAAVDALTKTVAKLQETARAASAVGAAVIPAVAAAVQAWRASGDDRGPAAPLPEPAPEQKPAVRVAP